MRRKYTKEEFRTIVQAFRKEIPEIHIATDIIVGFPTESEEQFLETKAFMKEMNFEVINLSRFAARPKTLAAKMSQLPNKEIQRRSKIIAKNFTI